MRITFMGTAASEGLPGAFCQCRDCMEARKLGGRELRSRSEILVNEDLLVDMGPETYWKSVLYGIELSRVKYLFVTHSHSDHLDEKLLGFRGGWFGKEMVEPVLKAYGNEQAVEKMAKRLSDCAFDFVKEATVCHVIHEFDRVQAGEYEVTALPAVHSPDEECLLYLIRDEKGNSFLYATDTGRLTEETYEYLKGRRLDCVIMDCTLGNKPDVGISHMGLKENLVIKERLMKLGVTDQNTRFLCTHISHGTGGYEYLSGEAKKLGIEVAYDGMQVEWGCGR